MFEVSERVQRLAEGLEQSDGFVVSEKSGDFGAKFVDVEDEAVRQGHVFDRLRQQREDRNEGRSSNGDLQRLKYLETWSQELKCSRIKDLQSSLSRSWSPIKHSRVNVESSSARWQYWSQIKDVSFYLKKFASKT